jgi:hypothetical protein
LLRPLRRAPTPTAPHRLGPAPAPDRVSGTYRLYKTECVYGPDATGRDDVYQAELATLGWLHWFNEDRLHGHCRDVPPAEFEAAFYAAQQTWEPTARASIRPRTVQSRSEPTLIRARRPRRDSVVAFTERRLTALDHIGVSAQHPVYWAAGAAAAAKLTVTASLVVSHGVRIDTGTGVLAGTARGTTTVTR